MGEILEQKALVAAVALYHDLDKPVHRSYLQRNLRAVLDAHEQRLSTGGQTTANVDTKHFWDFYRPFPTREMAEAAFRGHQWPVLSLTSLKLRRAHERSKSTTPSYASDEDDNPAWLPGVDESEISCHITVAILDPHERRPRYLDSRQGTMIYRGRDTRNPTFAIALHQPFEIEVDQLLADRTGFSGEHVRIEDHTLEIGIHCLDSDDEADFRRQIGDVNPTDKSKAPATDGIIRVAWENLPHLPQPGTALPLQRGRKNTSNVPFSAEVSMSWNEGKVSPLAKYNRAVHVERRERLQLPTPASEDLEVSSHRLHITYLFRSVFQTRILKTRDLKCILCDSRAAHSSFERLRLHYLTHHDHLDFEASHDPENPDRKILRVSNPEDRLLPQAEKPKEWDWQAPGEAFNIAAHVEGDSMWTHPHYRPRATARTVSQRHRSGHSAGNLPAKAHSSVPARSKRQLLPPEEVPDLPSKKVKRHKVPSVPGIHFYRTTSKQTLEQGTELSDSDDEIDETFNQQSQRQQLLDLGVDSLAIDFHELFNRHFTGERPMADRHARDAVIRFARKFRSKLSNLLWAQMFRAKLHQLETRKIVGKDAVDYCLKLITYSGENIWREDMKRILGTPQPAEDTNDVYPDSPLSAQGARIGGDDVAESPAEFESEASKRESFGHWRVVAIKSDDPKLPVAEIAVTDLIQDEHKDKAKDELQTSDLDFEEFLAFLERELSFDAGTEHIFCKINIGASAGGGVDDAESFLAIISQATKGPIVVELVPVTTSEERRMLREQAEGEAALKPMQSEGKGKENRSDDREEKENLCVCGERAESMRKTIACANARCVRAFHMQCVNLEERSLDWRCPDCTE